jgi:DNA-binding transcriptional ArsR family regulator
MSDVSLWTALADPHRRAIVALLLERPRAVGEIVEACGQSQPSTSKHLRVLRDAGLVRVRQDAQRRVYALDPAPIATLDAWLAPYRKLWNESLDALGRRLDEAVGEPSDEHGGLFPNTGGLFPNTEELFPNAEEPLLNDDAPSPKD